MSVFWKVIDAAGAETYYSAGAYMASGEWYYCWDGEIGGPFDSEEEAGTAMSWAAMAPRADATIAAEG